MRNIKFALIGNGFIAPKHIEAIKEVGGELVAVCDIDESKKVEGVPFFTDYKEAIKEADIVSICTPNYLHSEMVIECAKQGKKIISEKPATFKVEEIEFLKNVPNLFSVFQLRHLPEISEMRKAALKAKKVILKVEMKRSRTYAFTWKGDHEKSGGLLINIGIHYFDLLGHLFGYTGFKSEVIKREETESYGVLNYIDLEVYWSIHLTDEQLSYERSLTIDGKKFDLVQKENLHIKVYENLLFNQGTTVREEKKILKMIYAI